MYCMYILYVCTLWNLTTHQVDKLNRSMLIIDYDCVSLTIHISTHDFFVCSSSSIDELNPENTLGPRMTTLMTDTDSGDGNDQSRVDVCLNYENPLENTECEFWSEAAGVLATQEARGFDEENSQEPLNPQGYNIPSTHVTTSRSLTTHCGSTVNGSKGCLDNPPSNRLPSVPSVDSMKRTFDSEPTSSVSLDEFDLLLSQVDERQLRHCESLTPRMTESDAPVTSSNL